MLFYLLLILTFIDLDTMRLPNALVGPLAAVGLAAALVSQLSGVGVAPLHRVAATGLLSSPLLAAFAARCSGAA